MTENFDMEKKYSCKYCGQNPVPHFLYWYNESLNIALTPLRQKLIYNGVSRFIKRNWSQSLLSGFFTLFTWFGIIRINHNPSKCTVRRAQVLWEEATRRNIYMSEYLLLGKNIDMYAAKSEIRNQKSVDYKRDQRSSIIFSGLPRPANYFNKNLDILDDKALFKKMMRENRLPVPRGGAVTSWQEAQKIFERINRPVIVKPRAGSRGRHSTTHIYNREELKQGFFIAKKLCYWVMVEEQLFGPVYRATVINFKLEGVLRGDPPQVVGDGVRTIAELVAEKNSLSHLGVKNIELNNSTNIFLSREQLSLLSIPGKGQVVDFSEKIGVNYGGSSSEDFDICHPENKKLFEQAARALGDPLVGFDFIIQDITKSYKQQKCGFIEVNTLPFINLHHDPLHGQPRNVAGKVWDMVGFSNSVVYYIYNSYWVEPLQEECKAFVKLWLSQILHFGKKLAHACRPGSKMASTNSSILV